LQITNTMCIEYLEVLVIIIFFRLMPQSIENVSLQWHRDWPFIRFVFRIGRVFFYKTVVVRQYQALKVDGILR